MIKIKIVCLLFMACLYLLHNHVVARLEKFYEAFEEQWMIENKSFGFDVQDIRLGGLIMRIKHCKNMLAAYIDGRLKNIPELEQPILNVSGALDESGSDAMCMNLWTNIVTANII